MVSWKNSLETAAKLVGIGRLYIAKLGHSLTFANICKIFRVLPFSIQDISI